MNSNVAPCPCLPLPDESMDYRALSRHGTARDAGFYQSALVYGHYLWLAGHAGRAMLALTRALYAEVSEHEPVLDSQPLPYEAMFWMLVTHPSDDFPGNPRISYQHQACRLRGARHEIRSARAWAVWALACAAKPGLPGDPGCPEPSIREIRDLLNRHGHRGEAARWERILSSHAAGLRD